MKNKPFVSIVIPVMNEEECIPALGREVSEAFDAHDWAWECVWIDDGSSDTSRDKLRQLASEDPHHRFIAFKKNAGQSAALWAGFKESRGAVIATLDGDGQNDPADLPRLVQLLEESDVDMVNGYRQIRSDNILRKIASRIGNGARNMLTGKTVSDVGCSTRCFKRECVELLPPFAGMHRFLPTLVALHGFRFAEVPVNHRPRLLGQTKYSINSRLWVGLYDLLGVRWFKKRAFHYAIKKESK